MKRHAIPSILAALLTLSVAVPLEAVPPSPADPGVEGAASRNVAEANNEFGFALYELVRQSGEENVFFSPASLSTALAMTYAGARGATATEIRTALRWTLDDDDLHPAVSDLSSSLAGEGSGLALANALWGRRGMAFHREFLELAGTHYEAGFDEVDFAEAPDRARQTINAWVDDRTDHEIEQFLLPGDVDPSMILVLTNAIRFKGTWKVRFDDRETREAAFHVAPDREVAVAMMRTDGSVFRHFDGEGLELLELPYDGDRISMLVLLPDDGRDLAELEAKLSARNLASWISRAQPTRFRSVEIPRFESSTRLGLRDALTRMGISLAFTPDADFSGMTPSRPAWIDDVFHEARVRLDEEGTQAAGSAAVTIGKGPAVKEADLFRADRPFVYLIRDRHTGTVLFLGRLTDPEA
jgi:serpin B